MMIRWRICGFSSTTFDSSLINIKIGLNLTPGNYNVRSNAFYKY